ncbi:MAG: TerB family tellurite resistance protein [Gemmatimonadetes bacterium]|nr:TerB family tellurite resistance protein [Gemmatimonadota bacterium]
MSSLTAVVGWLLTISVFVSILTNYLIINKLWKRKHLKDVAESVSISAALLGIATALPLLAHFVIIGETQLVVKNSFGILTGVIFILIGAGLWVRSNRGVPIGRLMRRALRLERQESSYLIKSMTRPKGAERILDVLELMARLDRQVHESEIRLLADFADRWHIDRPRLEPGEVKGDGVELEVRDAVRDYLELSPPHEQAAQLMDVLNLFVKADAEVSEEERVVLEEINGLIEHYVSEDTLERRTYEVLIVPQSSNQFEAAETLLPGCEIKERRGGKVISVGTFYSHDYAEAVCQKYIALGLFTAQVSG